ncbi:MAG: hypothetical protein QM756_18275 [Polyangiaceae bacterium]
MPPRDWSRTSGLVEDIRKAYREIDEQERLELDSQRTARPDREPSEPIELPSDVRAGDATPAAPAAAPAPRRPAGRRPAVRRPAAAPQGQNDVPFRVTPLARNVEPERVE